MKGSQKLDCQLLTCLFAADNKGKNYFHIKTKLLLFLIVLGLRLPHFIYKRFSKFVYVDVCVGKCLLTSCERVIQKKTLNPFILTNPVGCFITIIAVKTLIQQVNSMKTQIRLTRRVLAEPP